MRVAIIQARMGSTRLPGKVLLPVADVPMIACIIKRIGAARRLDKIVLATTSEAEDDELAQWVSTHTDCDVFRGSRDDVLDRYYRCAVQFGASIVARITADDPFKDPEIVDRAIELLEADPHLDYCSNTMRPTFPEGLDVEAFRFSALETAAKEATLASEREHVTPFIWKRPERFRTLNFEHAEDLSAWRWTVDKEEDLRFANTVFRALTSEGLLFSYRAAIDLIMAQPALMEINSGTVRNEGYLKSIKEDHA